MSKNKKPENNLTEFQRAMRELKDISKKHKHGAGGSKPTPQSQPLHYTENIYLDPLPPDAPLQFKRSGVQAKTLKALSEGQLAPAMTVDLHGHTLEEAATLLEGFILEALTHNHRTLKVIHGKGPPNQTRLKTQVAHWLKHTPQVLAYTSCPPKHGGTGAVYVLLKST